MPNDAPFRNPPKVVRSILVAGVLAMPGAILGLMLAMFMPGKFFLLAAGIAVGSVTGFLMELN
jgi:hypothetical protein